MGGAAVDGGAAAGGAAPVGLLALPWFFWKSISADSCVDGAAVLRRYHAPAFVCVCELLPPVLRWQDKRSCPVVSSARQQKPAHCKGSTARTWQMAKQHRPVYVMQSLWGACAAR